MTQLRKVAGVMALLGGIGAAAAIAPGDAAACGGCFAPVGQPTVVTAHRMAVSLSTSGTTLWDQIQYAGAPEDFVWVLPIKGTMAVELADNAFFEGLEAGTQISLRGTFPPLTPSFCSDPCYGGDSRAFGAAGADAGAGSADASVTVYHEGTAGPYETATIGSADPEALLTWLHDHNYSVPDAIAPTIRYYVDNGFNFAALRLSPNAGVQQMQPVRVTTPGLGLTFPLRMVGAGASDTVSLELFVFAEGRYEARNFPTVEIAHSAIFYDWNTRTFNYDALFDRAIADNGGRGWIAEYAGTTPYAVDTWSSWDPSDGTMHTSADDWAVASRGISGRPYLTKLRTNLAARFLDQDILLQASLGGEISNDIPVDREVNRPPPPPPCPTVCTDPTRMGGGTTVGWPGATSFRSGGGGDGLCSVSPGREGTSLGILALAAAALGLALSRRRKR